MHSVLLARWTNGPRMHRVLRRTASALEIGNGRVPNFCHDFGKARELTQNAQRVASALCVYRACAPRTSGAGLARSTHVWRAFGVYIPTNSNQVEGLCPFTFHAAQWHRSSAPAAILRSTRNRLCIRIVYKVLLQLEEGTSRNQGFIVSFGEKYLYIYCLCPFPSLGKGPVTQRGRMGNARPLPLSLSPSLPPSLFLSHSPSPLLSLYPFLYSLSLSLYPLLSLPLFFFHSPFLSLYPLLFFSPPFSFTLPLSLFAHWKFAILASALSCAQLLS